MLGTVIILITQMMLNNLVKDTHLLYMDSEAQIPNQNLEPELSKTIVMQAYQPTLAKLQSRTKQN